MPAANRTVVAGQPHHITHRGHNRDDVFRDDVDCSSKLSMLLESSILASCEIHAYIIMSNHFHLIATPTAADGLARMMQRAGKMYGDYFNFKYGRSGTVWEKRYDSFVIDSDRYFFACSLYIEMNPVRAQMVQHPSQHLWSSFHRNALGISDKVVTPHRLYSALGKDDSGRRKEYASLFASHLDPDVVKKIQRGFRPERSKHPDEGNSN